MPGSQRLGSESGFSVRVLTRSVGALVRLAGGSPEGTAGGMCYLAAAVYAYVTRAPRRVSRVVGDSVRLARDKWFSEHRAGLAAHGSDAMTGRSYRLQRYGECCDGGPRFDSMCRTKAPLPLRCNRLGFRAHGIAGQRRAVRRLSILLHDRRGARATRLGWVSAASARGLCTFTLVTIMVTRRITTPEWVRHVQG